MTKQELEKFAEVFYEVFLEKKSFCSLIEYNIEGGEEQLESLVKAFKDIASTERRFSKGKLTTELELFACNSENIKLKPNESIPAGSIRIGETIYGII